MKRRSVANSAVSPPLDFRLVLDENLSSPRILDALRVEGIPVDSATMHFPRGATDAEVIDVLRRAPRLFLLGRDRDFRYHAPTRQLLRQGSLGVFTLTSAGNKNAEQLAQAILTAWPGIQRFVARHAPPFSAVIHANGRVMAM